MIGFDHRKDAGMPWGGSAAPSPSMWAVGIKRPGFRKKRLLMKFEPLARSLIATALIVAYSPTFAASQAPVAAENGMVVTAQHLATHVGVDVLKDGGNAVDAAVAVGYALAVVYPAAGNLGGGGFMTVQLADGRKTFIDFREKAPLAATANMYLDKDGNVIPDLSAKGHLPSACPAPCQAWSWR